MTTRLLGLALLLFLLPVDATAVVSDPFQLHATWHAPIGQPRASATLETACADTSTVDTLYLAFTLARPVPAITVMHGTLQFFPAAGDTLRDFWSFKTGTANAGNMLIDFAPFVDVMHASPWADHGAYDVKFDRQGAGGRLELMNYVRFDHALGLDPGVPYCFARVRIHHRRADLPGCRQSACMEWTSSEIGFATGRKIAVRGTGEGVARWNPDPGRDCALPRAASMSKPWTPKTRR